MVRVLVLGVAGMLGGAIFRTFSAEAGFEVWGTLRKNSAPEFLDDNVRHRVLLDVDAIDNDRLLSVMAKVKPDVVINCIGLIKQLESANDPIAALSINALFPHRLARMCQMTGARLVHVSTDCVFSGEKGGYLETDRPDADDLYGRSKLMGEIHDSGHAVTLRTSIIGHGVEPNRSLIDWFLAQEGSVRGFSRAIFSGLPAIELARVIKDYVLPAPELAGLYHVAAKPVSKLDLLRLVASRYEKVIDIVPDGSLVIDRSLDGSRFCRETGYQPPEWVDLVSLMHGDYRRAW